jgi:peptidoglycan hydrolase-like protein with peptidoglycan-binding domain
MKDTSIGGKVPNGEILFLQQLLNKHEGVGIAEDGDFGPDTYKAVVAFQKRVGGLKTQGVVGPDTVAVMRATWGY